MRNLLCLFAVITLFSRYIEDDDNSSYSIYPPDWISGTWLIDDPNLTKGWKFTSKDVIIIQNGGIQISHKELIDYFIGNGQELTTMEKCTNETYSLELY